MTRMMEGNDIREQLLHGADTLSAVVAPNYGPEGRNTVADRKYDLPMVVNTGRRILEGFELSECGENVGAGLLREAALKLGKQYGDGTIAAVILCRELLASGLRRIAAGHNPVQLREGLAEALSAAQERLRSLSVPCDGEMLRRFASSVSKNAELGDLVLRAFDAVGPDGVVTVQDSQGRESLLNCWEGVRYGFGLMDNVFAEDRETFTTTYEKPAVMLVNQKIKSIADIQKVLEGSVRYHVPLLIIAADIDGNVQRVLAANAAKRVLRVTVAKAPGHGDTRRRNMLALAAKTGSLFIEENGGHRPEDCTIEMCAQVDRAVITKDSTLLQGFRKESPEMVDILKKHTERLLSAETDPDEVEKLQLTLAILNGRIVEIVAGGVTEYEMFEKKYLLEDTVCAVRTAFRSGLVPGGGSAYLRAAAAVEKKASEMTETYRAGAECLAEALLAPVRILADNAGDDGSFVTERLRAEDRSELGYNVLTHRLEDLVAQGIQDPTESVLAALTAAADTAGALWTAEAAVLAT